MAVKKKNVSLKMGKHKSRTGGLTAAGRAKYNRATGSNLKAPQPGGGPRKRSFCARMKGVKGPMKKPNGKPTRKALAYANGNANMAKTYDMDGSESDSIPQRMDRKKKMAMLPHEFESIQRQYGNKKYGEYTIEDKKNVINYYKKQKKGKV